MQPGRRITGLLIMLGALFVLSLTFVGCNTGGWYIACDLPPGACDSDDGNRQPSCAEDPSFQCDTGACGRYKGSAGFCTASCETDSDCPDGTCEAFILVTDDRYCVPSDRSLIAE
ncbi:MAG: hypothetical protein ACQEVA_10875 [Myxococcota bacterium]